MSRVGVLGAGTMGIGVAQTLATHGHEVVLVDVADDILRAARQEIATDLRLMPLVRRDTSGPAPDEVLDRIRFTTDLTELRDAGFVVENVTENWATKRDLYPEIDRICPTECVFGVNTSAIPISRIASVTERPARVVGVHFMNPVPLKPVVEVIRGAETSDETIDRTRSLLTSMKKSCVVIRDSAGFVTNRILMLTINEAIHLMAEQVANAPDIDRLCRGSFGHAMGPLETADLIGLDTVMFSLQVLEDHLKDDRFRPSPLLASMVDAGLLGRKTGRGFYSYESSRLDRTVAEEGVPT
ncbi:3-hydroxyacyl-CoA dehydrogenase family protein [Actinophytocola sp.]|uniref:3-hydroxyacyl-CoA dehydrogenase family protein n=1 Tax=Actinophytocola sp. TaxID=1872138 RepID=UPI003D6A1623